MKDIGLGILDPYTVTIALITLVLSQVLFGNEIPLSTTDVLQLFISLVIFTGYLYVSRSLLRLPIAAIWAWGVLAESGTSYYLAVPRWHGLRNILHTIKDIVLLLLRIPVVLVFFLFAISNFSSLDFNYQEKKWSSALLMLIERVGLIIIAFVATLPNMQNSVQVLGSAGLVIMVFVFMLKGNFSALIKDNLNKVLDKKQKDKNKNSENESDASHPKSEQKKIIQRHTNVYISHCKICNKPCAGESETEVPVFCSLQCRQKWFPLWERDWEIGDEIERKLIEEQRGLGYSNFEIFSQTTLKLKENAIDFLGEKATWALLAMIRDLSTWNYSTKQNLDQYKRHLQDILEKILKEKEAAKYVYLSVILDKNEELAHTAINLLTNTQYDYPYGTFWSLRTLLNHESLAIRLDAIILLGRIQDFTGLYNHIGQKDIPDDTYIINILKSAGEVTYLEKLQKHPTPWIREEATEALISLGIEIQEADFIIATFPCPNCKTQNTINIPTGWQINKVRKSNVFKNVFRQDEMKLKCDKCKTSISVKASPSTEEIFRRKYKEINTSRRNIKRNRYLPSDDFGNGEG